MLAAKLISIFLKDTAIALIDHKGVKHHCGSENLQPSVILRLTTSTVHWRLLFRPQIAFGEGYMTGEIQFEKGTLKDLMEIVFRCQRTLRDGAWGDWLKYWEFLRSAMQRWAHFNSKARSLRNVGHHYEFASSFFEKFLDPAMQYTCGYFRSGALPAGEEHLDLLSGTTHRRSQ